MSQIDNLQILIDALQNIKQGEAKREEDERNLHSRLAWLEAETECQRSFIQQLHSLTEKYLDHTL